MPLFVRKFIVDAVEGAVTGVLLLQLVFPQNTGEAIGQGTILGAAVFGAIVAAVRRNAAGGFAYLRESLNVPPTAG